MHLFSSLQSLALERSVIHFFHSAFLARPSGLQTAPQGNPVNAGVATEIPSVPSEWGDASNTEVAGRCIAAHHPRWNTAIIGAAVGPALLHHSRSGPTSPWSAPGSSRPARLSSLQSQQRRSALSKQLFTTAVANPCSHRWPALPSQPPAATSGLPACLPAPLTQGSPPAPAAPHWRGPQQ